MGRITPTCPHPGAPTPTRDLANCLWECECGMIFKCDWWQARHKWDWFKCGWQAHARRKLERQIIKAKRLREEAARRKEEDV
jgi:hypothetical protein